MIKVMKAEEQHIDGIIKVCSSGYWATYGNMFSKNYISGIIEQFYNYNRVEKEVNFSNYEWGGYYVALDNNEVVGAGGGGMIQEAVGELFVLYVDPERRNEGIGSQILNAITKQQITKYGAKEQWVSVAKDNYKGIPFYEAKGFVYIKTQKGYGKVDGESHPSLRYWRTL